MRDVWERETARFRQFVRRSEDLFSGLTLVGIVTAVLVILAGVLGWLLTVWDLTETQWIAVATVVLAAATIVLALVTAGYLSTTRRMANSAEASAKASERSAEIARTSLLLRTMPIVVGYEVHPAKNDQESTMRVFNAGVMPAFNVMATIYQGNTELGVTSGPKSLLLAGAGENWEVGRFYLSPDPYEVEITYYDPLGNGYRTIRTSLLGGQSTTRIERWDEEDQEWVTLVESGIPRLSEPLWRQQA